MSEPPRGTWYDESQLLLHMDLHVTREMPSPGSGITVAKAREILRQVRPQAVQFHGKGHPGYATYPTRIGTAHPGLTTDLLALWGEAARAEGVRFFIYYSAGIDNLAGEQHPEWAKRKSDGSIWDFGAHFVEMCFTTGYVTDLYYPMLAEMIERYRPDGFWMDAEIGSIVHCWCDRCVEAFRNETGLAPPRSGQDPGVTAWADFGRDMFRRHLRRTADFIHAHDPACLYSSSSAFSEVMPEPVVAGVDYLTGDLNPQEVMATSDFRARTYRASGVPFDVMLFTDGYAWGERPMQPKPAVQLCQESIQAAVHGGKVWMWILPNPDASVPEIEVKHAGAVGRFLHDRKPLLAGATAAREAWVLNSRSFAYQRQDGFQYDGLLAVNRWAEEVRGAHRVLLEGHYQFDVVHEDHLREGIPGDIRLLLIPDQGYLPEDVVRTVEAFARRGGAVLASGSALVTGEHAGDLQSLFGIQMGKKVETLAGPQREGETFPTATDWWEMEIAADAGSRELSALNYFRRSGRAGSAAIVRPMGRGMVLAIAGDVFRLYHHERHPILRQWLFDLLNTLLPNPMVAVDTCPGISCVVNRRGNQTIIHLIDRTSADAAEPNFWFVERPGHTGEVRVCFASPVDPVSVTMGVAGEALAWKRKGDYLDLRVPRIHIHEAIVVQV